MKKTLTASCLCKGVKFRTKGDTEMFKLSLYSV